MINYTWTINTLVKPSVTIDGTTYENVVEEIIWRCTGIETGTNTTAYEEQTWPIGFEDPSSFIEFDNLNIDLIISWIMNEDVKDNQYRLVADKIERLNNTKEVE
jgi:hypothetical protein